MFCSSSNIAGWCQTVKCEFRLYQESKIAKSEEGDEFATFF